MNSSRFYVDDIQYTSLGWPNLSHDLRSDSFSQSALDVRNLRRSNRTGSKSCASKTCRKQFGLLETSHFCKRCGDAFCKQCVSQQMRINVIGRPDPNGRLMKVCKSCYEETPQLIGQYRSLKAEFVIGRSGGPSLPTSSADSQLTKLSAAQRSSDMKSYRQSLDYDVECRRLTEGYKQSISRQPGILRSLSNFMFSSTANQQWQKSRFAAYGELQQACQGCAAQFNALTRPKHVCCVCGVAVCGNCSSDHLLLYVPDTYTPSTPTASDNTVHWCIIRFEGCPDKEPAQCCYCRVCEACRDTLAIKQCQVARQRSLSAPSSPGSSSVTSVSSDTDDATGRLLKVWQEFYALQAKVDDQLTKYKQLLNMLEGGGSKSTDFKSNSRVLAKAQTDLVDHFAQLADLIVKLKRVKVTTPRAATVHHNFVLAKCQYYHEHAFTFRKLQRRLETMTSPEVLSSIQRFVDHNAINCCYVCFRQLLFELLNMDKKYSAESAACDFATFLSAMASLLDVVEGDLKSSLDVGTSWDEHNEHINEFVKLELTEKRLLLQPKHGQQKAAGGVLNYVRARSSELVLRCDNKLRATAADHSFPRTKAALTAFRQQRAAASSDVTDWELLDIH